jgi:RHS repeat-associated protein
MQCSTQRPVLYSNGQVILKQMDVAGAGFGSGWSHTRTYSNQMTESEDRGNGYNWFLEDWPYLERTIYGDGWLVLLGDATDLIWFKPGEGGSGWVTLYGRLEKLTESGGKFTLTYPDGTFFEFNDLNATSRPGQFVKMVSPGGVETRVAEVLEPDNSSSSAGDEKELILEVQRSVTQSDGSELTESFLYDFYESGPQKDRLEHCTLRRRVTSGSSSGMGGSDSSGDDWELVQRALYLYYEDSDANGSLGDLKRVQRQNFDNGNWVSLDYQYYRYWKDGDANGFEHGLKFELGANGYATMIDDGVDPETASDSVLMTYADKYFEYDGSQRVTLESTDGGSATWIHEYAEAETPSQDYNTWQYKTTITRPDDAVEIVFTNFAGQVLLHVLQEDGSSSGSGDEWCEYEKFDDEGRVILRASPSAVASWDEDSSLLVTLKSDAGFIRSFTYNADEETAPGYLAGEFVQQGSGGTPIAVTGYEYSSRTGPGGETIYPLAREIVYPDDSGTATAYETAYAYEWHGSTTQVKKKTTTLPIVTTGQNGSNVANTIVENFDEEGFMTRRTDERGINTDYEYDIATGATTQMTQDVGGLGLITDYTNDVQGRTTEELGPVHEIDLNGTATMVRSATWMVYDDASHEVRTGRGFHVSGGGDTLVNPVSISKTDPDGRPLEQISAVRASTSGKLVPSDTFSQGSYVRWQTTQYTDCCLVSSQRLYHDIPSSGDGSAGTNYAQTTYGYDALKRRNRTVSPAGTITFNVLDVRGNTTETRIGTSDDGSGSGGNMVAVADYVYDDGNYGEDGNVTQMTQHVDGSTTRVTDYEYDWRNRQTKVTLPQDAYVVNSYDNLDRLTQADQHSQATDNLIGRNTTLFDSLGRVYRTERYGVDPDTGNIAGSLANNTWYGRRGEVIMTKSPESDLLTKMDYDAIGRLTYQYVGAGSETYADPVSVTGDTVLEQAESVYDDGSNLTLARVRQRYHDATGNGALTSPGGAQPKARVSYSASWYDGVGRLLTSADYGTNGGSDLARPALAPSPSDTVLVTTQEYDDAGQVEISTDPAGTQTRFEYDDAGRQTKLIENYQDGGTGGSGSSSSSDSCPDSADTNRATVTAYTVDGQVKTLTAENASTGDQTTTYTYGTTTSSSGVATGELLSSVSYPGSAGGTVSYTYDRAFERKSFTDQRGVVHQFDYDSLGRLTQDRVTTLPASVDGSVRRLSYAYDVRGLTETLTSHDNPTVGSGSTVNQVQLDYDDYSNLIRDYQAHSGAVDTGTTPSVAYSVASNGRLNSLTYPNGRVLTYSYGTSGGIDDKASRVAAIVDDDSTTLVEYEYLGQSTFVDTKYSEPDIRNTLIGIPATNDPGTGDIYHGLDRFGRVKDCRWYNDTTSSDVDRYKYGYDRASNRLWRENVVATSQGKAFDELYEYDGLYRLKDMGRGTLNTGHTALTTQTFAECWGLDETGNWENFRQADSGAAWTLNQTRAANTVNEITGLTNTVGDAWVPPAYDAAGNMTTIPAPQGTTWGDLTDTGWEDLTEDGWAGLTVADSYTATYDAWNRLVRLEQEPAPASSSSSSEAPQTVQENHYDARRFRILRDDYSTGTLTESRHLYYTSDWRDIEERTDTGTTPDRHFIWGQRYIDDLSLRDRSVLGVLNERMYSCSDSQWNATALVTSMSTVQSRFSYGAYGNPDFFDASWTQQPSSPFDWAHLFSQYKYDPSVALYDVRMRLLNPALGTWISRDFDPSLPQYQYAGDNPISFVDPSGLIEDPDDDAEAVMAGYWLGCGRLAHTIISTRFTNLNAGQGRVLSDVAIATIVKEYGNGQSKSLRRPDLVQITSSTKTSSSGSGCKKSSGTLYEIKPFSPYGRSTGPAQVGAYTVLLAAGMVFVTGGGAGAGTSGTVALMGNKCGTLEWKPGGNGMIYYRWKGGRSRKRQWQQDILTAWLALEAAAQGAAEGAGQGAQNIGRGAAAVGRGASRVGRGLMQAAGFLFMTGPYFGPGGGYDEA